MSHVAHSLTLPSLSLSLSLSSAGSAAQLENTELSNGIVQDDPEIIALQNDKVDILLHCIKSSSRDAAWIYGQVLCQIIRDLVPPNEILTKVIKEFLAINQPHGDVIATIVYQVSSSRLGIKRQARQSAAGQHSKSRPTVRARCMCVCVSVKGCVKSLWVVLWHGKL